MISSKKLYNRVGVGVQDGDNKPNSIPMLSVKDILRCLIEEMPWRFVRFLLNSKMSGPSLAACY